MAERFAKAAQRELGGRIGGLPRRPDEAEDTGDQTDLRGRGAAQHRQEGVGEAHRAPEIDVHQPGEIRQRGLLESANERRTGVRDEQRGAAMGGGDGLRQSGDGGFIRDIEHMGGHTHAMGPRGGGGGLEAFGITVGEGKVRAAGGEGQGQSGADAAGRTRDDRGEIFQWEGHRA